MEFLRKILNFERTTSETLNPNFREDAFPPCNFITSRGGRHLKERSKNAREYAAFVLRSPNKLNRAARKKQQRLFVFKTTVL